MGLDSISTELQRMIHTCPRTLSQFSKYAHFPSRQISISITDFLRQYLWIPAVFNGPCFLAIKLCLLFFYRRIFLVHQKWLRIFWWINLVYAVLWFFGSTLYYILQCLPANYYWERLYQRFHVRPPYPIHGECNAAKTAQVALPLIFSLISDFALLSIPIVTLARMQMSLRRKIALTGLFLLGLL